jgi:hypothetical protein
MGPQNKTTIALAKVTKKGGADEGNAVPFQKNNRQSTGDWQRGVIF